MTDRIRHFIYLDTERVRSYASQIGGGIIESIQKTAETEKQGKGAISGGIPFCGKGEVTGSILFHREATETRSIHHYLFTLFEKAMEKKGILQDMSDNSGWSSTSTQQGLSVGDFIRIRCPISIFDYQFCGNTLRTLSQIPQVIAEVVARSEVVNGKNSGSHQKSVKVRTDQVLTAMGGTNLPKTIESVANFLEKMQGNTVSLRAYPEGAEIPYVLARLDPERFQISRESMLFQFGNDIQHGWTLVAAVISIPPKTTHSAVVPQVKSENFNLMQLEDVMQNLMNSLITTGLKFKVAFPAIGVLPLAIYM